MKNNKLILIISLIVLPVFLLIFLFSRNNKPEYETTIEEMQIAQQNYEKNIISLEQFKEIYSSNDSLFCFVDLRDPRNYVAGHLPHSINLPFEDILNKKNGEILNRDKIVNVFYHSNHSVATEAFILLSQIGYKNNKVLIGDYDFIKKQIIDNFSPISGYSKNGTEKLNYKEIISKASAKGSVSSHETIIPTTIVPTKKMKKEEDVGGC